MRPTSPPALALALTLCTLTTLSAAPAAAFCGFYVSGGAFVSGGDATLFNDATQVALMRQGTKTVLSMQNNYKGPAEAFAMVVPVPVVLQQEDVKTLPRDVFWRLDAYSAPRLVEYWEHDPCIQWNDDRVSLNFFDDMAAESTVDMGSEPTPDPTPVKVEAQFAVGEYEVVVLSATEASELEAWLKDNQYNIPEGAAPIFKSYIQQGMYFFVAKVDPAKITYRQGEAVLSPLRFAYTSEDFSLPIRLGLVNSSGTQDLIITTLGDSRYEAANYPNATIPTNIEVAPTIRASFGGFYKELFDRVVAHNPGAVITEYAWDLVRGVPRCDPCPPLAPGVAPEDLMTLGGDVLGDPQEVLSKKWTFTRLHMRYGKDGLDEDITFRAAAPITGGREAYTGHEGTGMIERTQENLINQFQSRYAIRNRWTGPIACANPRRNRWFVKQSPPSVATGPNQGGKSAPLELPLERIVRHNIPEARVITQNPAPAPGTSIDNTRRPEEGCANTARGGAPVGLGLFAALGALVAVRRRRAGV